PRSQSAGTEAGEYVVAVGREEIAIGRAGDARTAGPAAAAQHLARAEPGLRVVLVGVGREPAERLEVGRGPFPHVADHLPAAEGAVAVSQGVDVDRSVKSVVEVGMGWRRRLLAPWPASPCSGELHANRISLADRRDFPFGFAWQASPGPAAPRFGLEPAHEND